VLTTNNYKISTTNNLKNNKAGIWPRRWHGCWTQNATRAAFSSDRLGDDPISMDT
jgi:hypothetical protein